MIDVKRTKFRAHLLCGLLVGIGGFLYTLLHHQVILEMVMVMRLMQYPPSVIGGVMLSGGVGLPIGTFSEY